MIFEANDLKSDKDTITYEAFVFDKIKPAGEKVGLKLDLPANTNATLFDGKVIDFLKAKVLVSRINLKKVTKATSLNMTIASE